MPEQTINQMEGSEYRMTRLNFDDDIKIIIRNAWNASCTKNSICKLLNRVVKKALKEYPLDKSISEPFAQKVSELQSTLNLTDFEVDVLLIFAFIRSELLCFSVGQCRRPDLNEKQIYVAKCLDCDVSMVCEVLRDDHKLRRYGCIDEDFDFNPNLFGFLNGVSNEPLAHTYYTRCIEKPLPWSYYGSLVEKHGDILKRIISSDNSKKGTIESRPAPPTESELAAIPF